MHFTPNPAYDPSSEVNGSIVPLFVCPITMLEFNGLNHFVFLWSTGYVLSNKALQEVGSDALQAEYGPFTESDIIPLLPPDEDIPLLREKLLLKQKAGKKRTAAATTSAVTASSESVTSKGVASEAVATLPSKKPKNNISNQSVLTNAGTAIKTHEEKSTVYKSLFHKDEEKKKTGNDLFMTVAGFRYTVS